MFCKYTDVKVMRGLEAGSVLVVYIILSFFGQLFAFMEPAKQPCTFTNKQKNCLRTRLVNIKTKTESRLKKTWGQEQYLPVQKAGWLTHSSLLNISNISGVRRTVCQCYNLND